MTSRPLRLRNEVQDYAWGSYTFIQKLLGEERSEAPWAELWMGAHPKSPSRARIDNQWQRLDEVIAEHPEEILGPQGSGGGQPTLPYLFKVLAAERPLSIQAHPDSEQAKNGFERENHEGIALNARNRSYKDDRRKPECICALTPFWVLKGFRPASEMIELLSAACPETLSDAIDFLSRNPHASGLQRFFEALMTLPENRIRQVIDEAAASAIQNQSRNSEFRWIKSLSESFPGDIGVLSPALLNLACLQPGEALFLNPGELHSYLGGCGIEIMANSDNVLRCGLTEKHVDVEELMRILDFRPRSLEILVPEHGGSCEKVYPASVEEFCLSVIQVDESCSHRSGSVQGPEILLCTEGSGQISWQGESGGTMEIQRGDSLLVPAAVGSYSISGRAVVYKASSGRSAAG